MVFSNNDNMAIGAMQAIQAAGRIVGKDIYLVGIDGLDEAVEFIRQGNITGTVRWDTNGIAHKVVQVAINAVAGKPLQKNYTVGHKKIISPVSNSVKTKAAS